MNEDFSLHILPNNYTKDEPCKRDIETIEKNIEKYAARLAAGRDIWTDEQLLPLIIADLQKYTKKVS